MSQFAVYRNPNPDTRSRIPYLLDVQSDLIRELATRVVVPLGLASAFDGATLRTLTPVFDIQGKDYVMLTPQLAGVTKKGLGASAADLSAHRDAIIAALDFLITGI